MAITPQTNATLEEIAEAILKMDNLCLCGHKNPDCDCIGSILALSSALRQLDKNHAILLAEEDPFDETLSFLPGSEDFISAQAYEGICDCFIVVDAPSAERIGKEAARIHDSAKLTITIDHHRVDERHSDLSYTDPDAASTTMLVWEMIKHLGVKLSKDIATCTYAGLLTDTGRFMFQNTDANAFASAAEMVCAGASPSTISQHLFQERTLASLQIDSKALENLRSLSEGRIALSFIATEDIEEAGALPDDLENCINIIRSLRGVEIACMLKERGDVVRGSLRSKGDLDISALARRLGGGGHSAAAGFTLEGPLREAISTMEELLPAYLAEVEEKAH